MLLISSFFLVWFGSPKSGRGRSTARGGVAVEDYARQPGSGVGGSGRAVGERALASASRGVVQATKGAVFVHAEGDTLPLGFQPVRPGEEIVTGKDGEAVLSVRKGEARAQLAPVSALKVGEGTAADPILRIRLGRVWVKINDPRIVVAFPLATILGSQGAVYEIRVVLSSATTVRVKDGTAWVSARFGGEEEQIVVASGRYVRVDPRSGIDTGPATEESGPSWLGLF